MILLIDIGNSRIKIGLCKNPNIKNKIDVFYCDNIKKINSVLKEIGISKFDSVLVSSVVPEINKNVIKIIEDSLKIKRALSVASDIDFYRYKVNFELISSD